ncbi:MAG: hypothetical protein R6U50_08970 [Desulfobacterales bacterium]
MPENTSTEQTAEGASGYGANQEKNINDRIAAYFKSRCADQVILAGEKTEKAAKSLKKAGDCFEAEEQRLIREYIFKAADRLERAGSYMQNRPIDGLKEDIREFSNHRTGMFIGACLAGGILLARVYKASQNSD